MKFGVPRPRSRSRGLQQTPKRLKEASKTPAAGPHEAPRAPQEASRNPPEAAGRLPGDAQEGSNGPLRDSPDTLIYISDKLLVHMLRKPDLGRRLKET
eukprot:5036341-Pyramimonas_sp.AAC.1